MNYDNLYARLYIFECMSQIIRNYLSCSYIVNSIIHYFRSAGSFFLLFLFVVFLQFGNLCI